MFLSRFFPTAVLFIVSAWPKTIPSVCGSSPTTHLEMADLHEKSQRRLRAAGITKSATSLNRSATRDVGDIVIMDDSDGVVARRNPFTLSDRKVTFTPASAEAKSYRFSTTAGDFNDDDSVQGSPLAGLGDDDSQAIPLPFSFPFFGNRYNSVFVNSDGNLTFTIADSASTDRSLGRLVAGPPRIALMFGDLDPSRVANSVRVRTLSASVVITWQGVPEYSDFGRGAPQTGQLRLFNDGRIEMVWQTISMAELVVGIAPGNLEGAPNLVSFSTGSTAVSRSNDSEVPKRSASAAA